MKATARPLAKGDPMASTPAITVTTPKIMSHPAFLFAS
jgi:hypothetical protein